ncbi:hypothetical protein PFISCL1PPCAC_20189 [Pristionchus fissidentatus]|uniref:HAP1 N-terminal domain-containing protein n=1 Tax=Pristionchus fissidentatus TaxID=1538716 RepID=A0AAV5WCY9_9BILA|nr:hypothetical protein PFISCL1PPCAC_20189 [Pristionchus fissidentatus]
MAESSSGHHSDLPSSSSTDLSSLLRQKEHDIEIAAQIGQSLLERNRELQNRNEFLEESLTQSSEQAKQLRYELHRRVELLRYFSIDDDQFGTDGDTTSLCRQVERLRRENIRLTAESNVLRKDLEGRDSESRRDVLEIENQLLSVSTQAAKLQAAICKKNEECAIHGENISRLIEEVNRRSAREKDLTEECDSLTEQLEVAVQRENELSEQMNGMQNLYAELKSMFNDAEAELRIYRAKPSPYRSPSVDSLYDSLASELETSDSGRWTPRGRRDPAPRSLNFTSPPIEDNDESTPTNGLSLQDELAGLTAHSETLSIEPSVPLPSIAAESVVDEPPPPDPVKTPVASDPVVLEEPEPIPEPEPAVVSAVQPDGADASEVPEKEKEKMSPERSLLFSYDSEFSLAAPPQMKMPTYLEEPEERPPTRSSSSNSLCDYEAPSLGEPGVPGTRDLRASLKKDVRRQVRSPTKRLSRPLERDFAAWRARKGLRPSAFFPEGSTPEGIEGGGGILSPYLVGDARSVLPWRMCSAIGLQGVRSMSGEGVLTRAELPSLGPSPSASPSHSITGTGLSISSLSSFTPSGGILLRRPYL